MEMSDRQTEAKEKDRPPFDRCDGPSRKQRKCSYILAEPSTSDNMEALATTLRIHKSTFVATLDKRGRSTEPYLEFNILRFMSDVRIILRRDAQVIFDSLITDSAEFRQNVGTLFHVLRCRARRLTSEADYVSSSTVRQFAMRTGDDVTIIVDYRVTVDSTVTVEVEGFDVQVY